MCAATAPLGGTTSQQKVTPYSGIMNPHHTELRPAIHFIPAHFPLRERNADLNRVESPYNN